MKIVKRCLISALALQSLTLFAQNTEKDFIKDYVAPDFKFRLLNFNLDANGTGSQTVEPQEAERHRGALNTGLTHRVFSNQRKYQGSYFTLLFLNARYETLNGSRAFEGDARLSHFSTNRFYLKPNFFLGAHGNFSIRPSFSSNTNGNVQRGLDLNAAPTISAGFGRVEFGDFARQAMDISKMLSKTNVIDEPLSLTQLKSLADQIGIIRNKRGLDLRLLRIWQLEQLDSTMTAIGVKTEKDIAYFSRLNDAYYFALFNNRFSGFRTELGVTTPLRLDYVDAGSSDLFSTLGFLNVEYYLPVSYAVQLDFGLAVHGGLSQSNPLNQPSVERNPFRTDATVRAGWFPTTRTGIELTVNGSQTASNDQTPGYFAGIGVDCYYYFSPATRLEMSVGYNRNEDLDGSNNLNPGFLWNSQEFRAQGYSFGLRFIHQIF